MKFAIVVGFAQEAAIVGSPDNAVVIIGGGNAARLASELNAAFDALARALADIGINFGAP
jgi:uridylate kinase